MGKTGGCFMKAAVIYGLIGFALGVYMGAKHEFALMSVHSHLNLLGWTSLAIFAFYYELTPQAASSVAAKAQFLLANIGLILMSISLALMAGGNQSAAPGAGIGAVLSFLSFIVFAYVVFKTPVKAA